MTSLGRDFYGQPLTSAYISDMKSRQVMGWADLLVRACACNHWDMKCHGECSEAAHAMARYGEARHGTARHGTGLGMARFI